MFKYLMELAIPMIIVINKTDKVKKQILEKTKKQAKELFF
jgi:GTP-binding protein EngB required for normal cell division